MDGDGSKSSPEPDGQRISMVEWICAFRSATKNKLLISGLLLKCL